MHFDLIQKVRKFFTVWHDSSNVLVIYYSLSASEIFSDKKFDSNSSAKVISGTKTTLFSKEKNYFSKKENNLNRSLIEMLTRIK